MTDAKNINQSPVQQGEVMIHVENLKKSFGDNVVLNGITQDIRKGEKVVIIGPSGSGKSTFLRCLNLLEVPTSGHIIFEGTDLTDKDTDINAIRRKMGMVFQHFRSLRTAGPEERKGLAAQYCGKARFLRLRSAQRLRSYRHPEQY